MSRLAIEPLSSGDEKVWTVGGNMKILLAEKLVGPPSSLAGSQEDPLPAREQSTYTIKGSEGTKILVRKTYAFATAAEADGKVRLTVTGDGDLAFDRESGVFASSMMTARVALDEGGSLLEEASMVQCGLIRVTQEPDKAP